MLRGILDIPFFWNLDGRMVILKAACLNGIESVMKNALLAEIKEVEQ
ncbi:TPA: YegP family protein [Candidatus Bathyarchaeota archaeon]|nr:YegP family protein [Candidatus Bathyarchaeota archaeon]